MATPPRVFMAVPMIGHIHPAAYIAHLSLSKPKGTAIASVVRAMPDEARNELARKAIEFGYEYVFFCFEGRTVVETSEGGKYIRDVTPGDLVLTHKGRFRPVLRTMHRTYREGLMRVRTAHSQFKCTAEHPIYILRPGAAGPLWVMADRLQAGDLLLYPDRETSSDSLDLNCGGGSGFGYKSDRWKSVSVTFDLARFLGLYLAEGCGGDSAIRFTFGNHEAELIEFISRFCVDFFGRKPTIYRRWATQVGINIRDVARRFEEWFGKKATLKKVPSFVRSWNLKNRLAFLKGYIEGDGHIRKNGVNMVSASEEVAEGVVKLAKSCGLRVNGPSVYERPEARLRDGKVIVAGKSVCWQIGTAGWGKVLDLLEAGTIDGFMTVPVLSVDRGKENRNHTQVYNLEVDEDNTYVVGPSSVHNCDDDMIPEPDLLVRLLEAMEARPEIGLLSPFAYRRKPPYWPCVFHRRANNGAYDPITTRSQGIFEVDATTLAATLVRASVFRSFPEPWFAFEWREGVKFSEDIVFCERAKKAGAKLFVDSDRECLHLSESTLVGRTAHEAFRRHEALQKALRPAEPVSSLAP